MGVDVGIAIAALVTTTAATVVSHQQASKSAAELRDVERVKQRQAAIENQRRIRTALAAGRKDRESLIAAGFSQGVGFGSSGIQGGLGSQQTQIAANVGFARQNQAFNANINKGIQRASDSASRANEFRAIAAIPAAFGQPFKESFKTVKEAFKVT